MAATVPERWVLDHDGHRLEVEGPPGHGTREVRLYVDGEEVASTSVSGGTKTAKLTHGDHTVKVTWDWRGHLSMVVLRPATPDLDIKDIEDVKNLVSGGHETWFTPPEGSRAARRERLARRYPRLYASRHVAAAVAKVLLPLLGVGLLIRIPKPDIDLPDIDLPDVDLPDIPRPHLPKPDIDLPDISLPDLVLPGWIQAIVQSAKYWVPILVAVGIAVQEHKRRMKQREKAARRSAEHAAADQRPDQRPDQAERRPRQGPDGSGRAAPVPGSGGGDGTAAAEAADQRSGGRGDDTPAEGRADDEAEDGDRSEDGPQPGEGEAAGDAAAGPQAVGTTRLTR